MSFLGVEILDAGVFSESEQWAVALQVKGKKYKVFVQMRESRSSETGKYGGEFQIDKDLKNANIYQLTEDGLGGGALSIEKDDDFLPPGFSFEHLLIASVFFCEGVKVGMKKGQDLGKSVLAAMEMAEF